MATCIVFHKLKKRHLSLLICNDFQSHSRTRISRLAETTSQLLNILDSNLWKINHNSPPILTDSCIFNQRLTVKICSVSVKNAVFRCCGSAVKVSS